MDSPAFVHTVNLDKGFSPWSRIGRKVQEVHYLLQGTWDDAVVELWNLKGAQEGNQVVLGGDTATR